MSKHATKQHIHEDAFRRGFSDFYKGNLTCPYSSGFYYIKEWHRGFNAAYFKNLAYVQSQERALTNS